MKEDRKESGEEDLADEKETTRAAWDRWLERGEEVSRVLLLGVGARVLQRELEREGIEGRLSLDCGLEDQSPLSCPMFLSELRSTIEAGSCGVFVSCSPGGL